METGLQRLMELYTWMQGEELGHKDFSFNCFNRDSKYQLVPNVCGTVGCALGEAPVLWAEDWFFNSVGDVQLRGENYSPSKSAEIFFELPEPDIDHLFFPYLQDVNRYGGKELSRVSTKQEVLENMKIFIERKYLQD